MYVCMYVCIFKYKSKISGPEVQQYKKIENFKYIKFIPFFNDGLLSKSFSGSKTPYTNVHLIIGPINVLIGLILPH